MHQPTEKRLEIARELVSEISDCTVGIMMGGSMGFGQNFSVREDSDIDLVVVCDISRVEELVAKPFFKGAISPEIIDLFKTKDINLFWNTKVIDGVEVNAFVYESTAYKDFCLLKSDLNIFIKTKPADTQSAYGFDGEKVTFDRNVREFKDGFLFTKPALANGKFWGGVPKQDFYYSGAIIHEQNDFLSEMEPAVWKATVKQLVTEYGKEVDLSKHNVLNTHFTFKNAPERLPAEVIENIRNRTKEELGKF